MHCLCYFNFPPPLLPLSLSVCELHLQGYQSSSQAFTQPRAIMCIYQDATRDCSFFSLLQMEQMLIASAVQLLQLVVKYNMKMH